MEVIDSLGTVAEFSIGLAGFSGIVAVLSRADSTVPEIVRFRFRNLLVSSFAPGFLSLLTIAMIYLGMEEASALRFSAVTLALSIAFWAVVAARTAPPGLNRRLWFALWAFAIGNVSLQVVAAWLNLPNIAGVYIFGLSLLLFQSALVFAALAMASLSGNDT